MNFWFEFFDIHMNEKAITCHDFHGFKWQNIIFLNIDFFLCSLTFLLDFWIVTTTKWQKVEL